eukprot:TRINITY_DN1540_c0_g2_i1.p1 TRINITY_DN1540_c0_g2~~TRINITY_DN1540_c0_g2_i1.p1  ORF type:complete len:815 (+),score=146.46 TRINITY_DN1540_c0_g2_i1:245-2446(+)
MAPVPEPWKACTENGDDVFYFNYETHESVWDHPCDEKYRTMTEENRKKHAESLKAAEMASRTPPMSKPIGDATNLTSPEKLLPSETAPVALGPLGAIDTIAEEVPEDEDNAGDGSVDSKCEARAICKGSASKKRPSLGEASHASGSEASAKFGEVEGVSDGNDSMLDASRESISLGETKIDPHFVERDGKDDDKSKDEERSRLELITREISDDSASCSPAESPRPGEQVANKAAIAPPTEAELRERLRELFKGWAYLVNSGKAKGSANSEAKGEVSEQVQSKELVLKAEKKHGHNSAEVAAALEELADCYRRNGEASKQREALERASHIWERVGEKETAESFANARAKKKCNEDCGPGGLTEGSDLVGSKYDGGKVRLRSMQRQARSVEELHGSSSDHPEVVSALEDLASAHRAVGDVEAGRQVLRRVDSLKSATPKPTEEHAVNGDSGTLSNSRSSISGTGGSFCSDAQSSSFSKRKDRGLAGVGLPPPKSVADLCLGLGPESDDESDEEEEGNSCERSKMTSQTDAHSSCISSSANISGGVGANATVPGAARSHLQPVGTGMTSGSAGSRIGTAKCDNPPGPPCPGGHGGKNCSGNLSEVSEDLVSELDLTSPTVSSQHGLGFGGRSTPLGDTLELSATAEDTTFVGLPMPTTSSTSTPVSLACRGSGVSASARPEKAPVAILTSSGATESLVKRWRAADVQVQSLARSMALLKNIREKQQEYLRLIKASI